jgi:hypothetical protein
LLELNQHYIAYVVHSKLVLVRPVNTMFVDNSPLYRARYFQVLHFFSNFCSCAAFVVSYRVLAPNLAVDPKPACRLFVRHTLLRANVQPHGKLIM